MTRQGHLPFAAESLSIEDLHSRTYAILPIADMLPSQSYCLQVVSEHYSPTCLSNSAPSSSSCRPDRLSDIRTRGRNASMDSNAFMYPGGGPITEDTCVECTTECQDATCTVPERTSQCTDQCVVVACDDPSHGEMSCHNAHHCDAACENGAECLHCNGFEEFVS
jgi:hypothetical protein